MIHRHHNADQQQQQQHHHHQQQHQDERAPGATSTWMTQSVPKCVQDLLRGAHISSTINAVTTTNRHVGVGVGVGVGGGVVGGVGVGAGGGRSTLATTHMSFSISHQLVMWGEQLLLKPGGATDAMCMHYCAVVNAVNTLVGFEPSEFVRVAFAVCDLSPAIAVLLHRTSTVPIQTVLAIMNVDLQLGQTNRDVSANTTETITKESVEKFGSRLGHLHELSILPNVDVVFSSPRKNKAGNNKTKGFKMSALAPFASDKDILEIVQILLDCKYSNVGLKTEAEDCVIEHYLSELRRTHAYPLFTAAMTQSDHPHNTTCFTYGVPFALDILKWLLSGAVSVLSTAPTSTSSTLPSTSTTSTTTATSSTATSTTVTSTTASSSSSSSSSTPPTRDAHEFRCCVSQICVLVGVAKVGEVLQSVLATCSRSVLTHTIASMRTVTNTNINTSTNANTNTNSNVNAKINGTTSHKDNDKADAGNTALKKIAVDARTMLASAIETSDLATIEKAMCLIQETIGGGSNDRSAHSDWFSNEIVVSYEGFINGSDRREHELINSKQQMVMIVKALEHLVPLQPKWVMVHHKILCQRMLQVRYTGCKDVIKEYIGLVKTRLCDLGEAVDEALTQRSTSAAWVEVKKYVELFGETAKVPSSLLQLASFQKTHYKKVFLPMLLGPAMPEATNRFRATQAELIDVLVSEGRIPRNALAKYAATRATKTSATSDVPRAADMSKQIKGASQLQQALTALATQLQTNPEKSAKHVLMQTSIALTSVSKGDARELLHTHAPGSSVGELVCCDEKVFVGYMISKALTRIQIHVPLSTVVDRIHELVMTLCKFTWAVESLICAMWSKVCGDNTNDDTNDSPISLTANSNVSAHGSSNRSHSISNKNTKSNNNNTTTNNNNNNNNNNSTNNNGNNNNNNSNNNIDSLRIIAALVVVMPFCSVHIDLQYFTDVNRLRVETIAWSRKTADWITCVVEMSTLIQRNNNNNNNNTNDIDNTTATTNNNNNNSSNNNNDNNDNNNNEADDVNNNTTNTTTNTTNDKKEDTRATDEGVKHDSSTFVSRLRKLKAVGNHLRRRVNFSDSTHEHEHDHRDHHRRGCYRQQHCQQQSREQHGGGGGGGCGGGGGNLQHEDTNIVNNINININNNTTTTINNTNSSSSNDGDNNDYHLPLFDKIVLELKMVVTSNVMTNERRVHFIQKLLLEEIIWEENEDSFDALISSNLVEIIYEVLDAQIYAQAFGFYESPVAPHLMSQLENLIEEFAQMEQYPWPVMYLRTRIPRLTKIIQQAKGSFNSSSFVSPSTTSSTLSVDVEHVSAVAVSLLLQMRPSSLIPLELVTNDQHTVDTLIQNTVAVLNSLVHHAMVVGSVGTHTHTNLLLSRNVVNHLLAIISHTAKRLNRVLETTDTAVQIVELSPRIFRSSLYTPTSTELLNRPFLFQARKDACEVQTWIRGLFTESLDALHITFHHLSGSFSLDGDVIGRALVDCVLTSRTLDVRIFEQNTKNGLLTHTSFFQDLISVFFDCMVIWLAHDWAIKPKQQQQQQQRQHQQHQHRVDRIFLFCTCVVKLMPDVLTIFHPNAFLNQTFGAAISSNRDHCFTLENTCSSFALTFFGILTRCDTSTIEWLSNNATMVGNVALRLLIDGLVEPNNATDVDDDDDYGGVGVGGGVGSRKQQISTTTMKLCVTVTEEIVSSNKGFLSELKPNKVKVLKHVAPDLYKALMRSKKSKNKSSASNEFTPTLHKDRWLTFNALDAFKTLLES